MMHKPIEGSEAYHIGQESLFPQEKLLEFSKNKHSITIGIPKDNDLNETRISLTPQGVNLVVESGHKVFVEAGAGSTSRYTDKDYSEAGASITKNPGEVYDVDVILKVLPPSEKEAGLFKERSTLFCMLSLAKLTKESIRVLMEKKVTAISLDTFQDEHNCYPIVRSLSEIEGIAAVTVATHLLSNATDGKGVLLGGITGISPAEVVILGAGTAGTVAARAALGMGAAVKVFDHSMYLLREISHNLGRHIFTSNLHPTVLSKALRSADVVIGTMRFLNGVRRFMLTEELIQLMKKGTVIVDLSVDQGGCFESSRPTSLKKPVYEKHGVIHHCLPSISALFPRSASIAFSNIISSLVLDIAQTNGTTNAIRESAGLRHGVFLFCGILTNHYVGKQFDLPSKDISLLLAAF